LNEEMSSHYKFKQAVFVAEIDLQAALNAPSSQVVYRPLPKYPGIVRDISFVVNRQIGFADIRNSVRDQNVDLCQSVEFVDVYEGKGLAENERSVTIRLEYRSDERTLIEVEVETVHRGIVAAIENDLGIKQRI